MNSSKTFVCRLIFLYTILEMIVLCSSSYARTRLYPHQEALRASLLSRVVLLQLIGK